MRVENKYILSTAHKVETFLQQQNKLLQHILKKSNNTNIYTFLQHFNYVHVLKAIKLQNEKRMVEIFVMINLLLKKKKKKRASYMKYFKVKEQDFMSINRSKLKCYDCTFSDR